MKTVNGEVIVAIPGRRLTMLPATAFVWDAHHPLNTFGPSLGLATPLGAPQLLHDSTWHQGAAIVLSVQRSI